MNIEKLKELANKELGMYDLTEILDDTVLDFFYRYLDKDLRYCKDCNKLTKDTIDLYEGNLPIWAIGRCTVPGHLYRKAVSPTFGCNLWEKE